MQFTVHVTCENEAEFAKFSAKFIPGVTAAPKAVTDSAEEPKPSAKAKAEKKTVAAKAEEPAPAEEESVSDSAETTYDDVKNIIMSVSRDKGRDAAVAVLAKFDLKKVTPDIPEDTWSGIVAEGKKILAA